MALLQDAFTDADETPLGDGTGGTHGPSHTSIGGYTYSTADRNCHISANNQLETVSDGPAQVCTYDIGDADQQIVFQFPGDSQVNNSRNALRLVDNDDFAVAVTSVGAGTAEVTKRDSGSTTQLDTFSFTAGDYIRLKAEGDTVSWWRSSALPANPFEDTNWTLVGSTTNTNANTETKAGFWLRGTSSSNTDDTDWIDNLQADTFPATSTDTPVVEATNTSFEGTNTTSHTVSLPSGVASGELLLALFSYDGIGSVTWPSGWTELFSVDADGASQTLSGAYRVADGSEGSTITVTTSASERSAHVTYRISGHDSGTPPEANAVGESLTSSADPPSLSPSWGAEDTLWLAALGVDDDSATITGTPSLYGGLLEETSGAGNALGALCASVQREVNTATEDPDAYTLDGSESVITATIAIRPEAAAGNDPISGSASLSFAGAGTLRGTGALSGTASMSVAPTATLRGTGKLTGSASLAFTPSATLGQSGSIAGSAALAFAATGTLRAKGKLAGTASLSFSPTGNLTDAGAAAPDGASPYILVYRRRRRD